MRIFADLQGFNLSCPTTKTLREHPQEIRDKLVFHLSCH